MQDYHNLEVIISDDCSTDNTQEIISKYLGDSRLTYVKNFTNLGRVANYKQTLREKVTGDWVLNVDGDDYLYEKDSISCMASNILEYRDRNVVAVMGSLLTVNTNFGTSNKTPLHYETGLQPGLDIFMNWNRLNFGHLATLYRVDLARAIDYYRLNIISSDWESVLRLILHGNVILTNKIVGVWNIHGNNATATQSVQERIEDYSYIEEARKYAIHLGIDKQDIHDWHRKMIRFHTKAIWEENCRLTDRLLLLIPYILRNYPFSAIELASPKAALKMVLRTNPKLYSKLRTLHLKRG